MASSHQKQLTFNQINELAGRHTFQIINRKQANVQIDFETCKDKHIRLCQTNQHENTANLPVQNPSH